MIEYYAQIKHVHVVAVIASGALFGLRGFLVLTGSDIGMIAPVRYLSYAIDTILLSAALMLWAMLPPALFANHWLTAKLALVALYVVLGSFALKRGNTSTIRAACFVAAMAAYLFIATIALAHHPLGAWALIGG